MRVTWQTRWRRVLAILILAAAFGGPARAAEYLRWDKQRQQVDANIQTWDVVKVLQRIAASTRWEIYLQPGAREVVPTRFQKLAEGDALRRLLGELSFVQVPQTNGRPRLYVFRTSRDDATQRIQAAEGESLTKARLIEDELVVKLKPGESIEELAKRLGAKVTGKIDGLNAYRLKFGDAEQAARARDSLLTDPSVAAVDYNYSLPQPDAPEDYSRPAPRLSLQPKAPADGKYLVVGLVDSAVQPKQGQFANFILDPISVVGATEAPSDQPTHGTAMSETILNGLASVLEKNGSTAVRILPVDVYGNNPTTSTFDVAVGITQAVNAGAKIINLSMGSEADSSILHEVITSSHEQGVIFLAAPGNEPVTTPMYPAAYPEVTAVTAVDKSGNIASYANRGSFVAAGAPGTVPITFNSLTFIITGTSASTAYASGVAAGLAETTGRSLAAVEKSLPTLMPVKK